VAGISFDTSGKKKFSFCDFFCKVERSIPSYHEMPHDMPIDGILAVSSVNIF